MTLHLTVHRGTEQIGGSCIELEAADGARLILDAGRPLDAPREAGGLLPATLDISRPAHVVFSHPHMDHWGLVSELPASWPLSTGEKSAALMRLTLGVFGESIERPISTWHSRQGALDIGGFRVTPFLTDHSALDAYMLLIERDEVRVLYTGDFRTHGRKAALVEGMIARPPRDIDVLLMEGTNLCSDKPVVTESDLEARFLELAQAVPGHLFVDWSAQNFDRTVTLFRTARRSGRDLVLDLYAADALLQIAEGTGLPCPGDPRFPELKVIITPKMKWLYQRMGRAGFVEVIRRGCATSRQRVAARPAIVMARKSLVMDYEDRASLPMTGADCFVHSSWRGYLDASDAASGWAVAARAGARRELVHTSGHASAADLSRFARAIDPRVLVPVHGVEWDAPGIALPPVQRLRDGERWTIGRHGG
ncbi:MBL fold metallo-hydrolase [Sphingomonas sp. CCH18-B1]|uniref:MBL fold metallo-hydrolase n=1 Tax=Sphingomonas sp. CCH18-B1 TaxID=1768744 RepID=UPI00082D9635|nr:MBL fold metallo-hydrolase [Sphingomonas sp. CCH18-B1]